MRKIIPDLFVTWIVSSAIILPFGAFETLVEGSQLGLNFRWQPSLLAIAAIVAARLFWHLTKRFQLKPLSKPNFLKRLKPISQDGFLRYAFWVGIGIALLFPLLPIADRRTLDVGILLLTYIMLGWGLSVVVGAVGMLDLGYIAFYAIGAYSYALLNLYYGLNFWLCLPLAGIFAASAALAVGAPILRLRGDYFAIVTLGFAEVTRIILINWQSLTKGPDGISGIARPSFFGLADFTAAPTGLRSFHELFGLEFNPLQRIAFLYYIILALALMTAWLVTNIGKLPLGRAFEALRENDIAAQSLGVNRRAVRMAAYMVSAFIGGLAGAFFAAKQGFISPESFTLMESIIVLAIVVLGGTGHRLGVVLSACILIGLPELFRELEQYRMVAFGAGLVMIMIWRPQGLFAKRKPSILLGAQNS